MRNEIHIFAPASVANVACGFDTLGFAQWMQWIFLPRVQEVVENERDMPAQSDVHTYAEEVLKNTDYESDQLLFLIKTFDEIVATGGESAATGN